MTYDTPRAAIPINPAISKLTGFLYQTFVRLLAIPICVLYGKFELGSLFVVELKSLYSSVSVSSSFLFLTEYIFNLHIINN